MIRLFCSDNSPIISLFEEVKDFYKACNVVETEQDWEDVALISEKGINKYQNTAYETFARELYFTVIEDIERRNVKHVLSR